MLYSVRTTSGREDIVIDILESKVRAHALDIKAMFHPAEIKGYIFIEGSLGSIQKAIQGVMHAKGIIEKPIRFDDVSNFLESKTKRIRVDKDDVVEIIGGPFKGEKGRVMRVDKVKDEVTIELLEASIPIPVTIATEFIRMVKKTIVPEEEGPEEGPEPAEPGAKDFEEMKEKSREAVDEAEKAMASVEEKGILERAQERSYSQKAEIPEGQASTSEESQKPAVQKEEESQGPGQETAPEQPERPAEPAQAEEAKPEAEKMEQLSDEELKEVDTEEEAFFSELDEEKKKKKEKDE